MSAPTRGPAVRELVHGALATCGPLDTLRTVAERLADDVIGVVLIGYPDDPVGIVSERDLVRAMAEGLDPDDARARDVMTEPVVSVGEDATVEDVARVMLEDEIRHVAVADTGGDVLGIVSIREVLSTLV